MDTVDRDQPFCREFRYEAGGQPTFILYSDQMLVDMERFYLRTCPIPPSPMAVDTTFNIGEFYFTETTYKNYAVVRQENGRYPWFPGPVLVHRNQRKEDFQYFWEAVCRYKTSLKEIAIIGSDECSAMYNGIKSVATNAAILFGIEHVEANVRKKLEDLHFP